MADKKQLTSWEIFKEEIVHLKWRVLCFACFVTFGSYYIYDFPGSIGTGKSNTIEAKFRDHGKRYDNTMNQALYSVYSWPNTVLAIFGGLLIDKFLGLRRAMLLFTLLVLSGAGLFYVGVASVNYPLMLIARVLFGLGGESLTVAQSAYVARWFKSGRGMALAFGIVVSFSRVGSSFNFLFSPKIAEAVDIDFAVLCGVFACCISLTACTVVVLSDIYATRKGILPAEAKDTAPPFRCGQLKELPLLMWIIIVVCVFSYTSIFPFIGIAENFFQVKFGISGSTASTYVSFYQFSSAAGSPIIGGIVDSSARNTYWMISATGLFAVIHFLMLSTPIPAYVMMVLMGMVYSMLVSSLWPAVPFAVDEHVVGFAYGMMTAMQNLGLATFPLLTGSVLDHFTPPANTTNTTNGTSAPSFFLNGFGDNSNSTSEAQLPTMTGFHWTEIIFIASAGVAFLFAVILLLLDLRGTGSLSCSSTERKRQQQELKNLLLDSARDEEEKPLNV